MNTTPAHIADLHARRNEQLWMRALNRDHVTSMWGQIADAERRCDEQRIAELRKLQKQHRAAADLADALVQKLTAELIALGEFEVVGRA